jgi:hypothetical protein
MARLRESALEFVKRERDWSIIVRRYGDLYAELVGAPAGESVQGIAP